MTFWNDVSNAIQQSDIVAIVLDARLPELSRNNEIEELIERSGKPLIFVVNKSDLVPRKFIEQTTDYLGRERTLFVSGIKNLGMSKLKERLFIMAKRSGFANPRVCFVGYPNVGKSSVINALVKRAKTNVSAKAGTTRGLQWVSFGSMRILDSPGVIPIDIWDEARLALLSAKNAEKLKNPEQAAIYILKYLKEAHPKSLTHFYGVPVMDDVNDIFEAIAKKRNYLLKGATLDTRRTALAIIRDWQHGQLRFL